jgi:hypothetical protein
MINSLFKTHHSQLTVHNLIDGQNSVRAGLEIRNWHTIQGSAKPAPTVEFAFQHFCESAIPHPSSLIPHPSPLISHYENRNLER